MCKIVQMYIGNATDLNALGIPLVHNVPRLGTYLQDHVVTAAFWRVDNDSFPLPADSAVDAAVSDLYNEQRTAVLASITLGNTQAPLFI
ncbi:unnamed protein product [Adineta ricciae]|uniref:Uncharacterized protein n=1 Tax=Adineta ricciae TaxID=249248 RepID=A0A814UA40_ADIRI|nr:unnamed protein product [Adineta ricciae]